MSDSNIIFKDKVEEWRLTVEFDGVNLESHLILDEGREDIRQSTCKNQNYTKLWKQKLQQLKIVKESLFLWKEDENYHVLRQQIMNHWQFIKRSLIVIYLQPLCVHLCEQQQNIDSL